MVSGGRATNVRKRIDLVFVASDEVPSVVIARPIKFGSLPPLRMAPRLPHALQISRGSRSTAANHPAKDRQICVENAKETRRLADRSLTMELGREFNRQPDQFAGRPKAKLMPHNRDIVGDRSVGNTDQFCDLGKAPAGREEVKNLRFSWADLRKPVCCNHRISQRWRLNGTR